MTLRLSAAAAALLLLSACATHPVPLQGRFDALSPHDAVLGNHAGAAVRWGGRIIRTEPRPDRTCFEIVSTPLGYDGRPYWTRENTWSRFIACRAGFHDPAQFETNREVTFTGRIEGYEDRQVAGQTYSFPRVAADTVYLWPKQVPQRQRRSSWPWAWQW